MTSRKLLHMELTILLKVTAKEIGLRIQSKLVHLYVLSDLF